MADTKIDVDLSPESVIKAMRDMGEETKRLAQIMEDSLGKRAVDNVEKLKKGAEDGSNQISTFFRNMGQRVREDLRTAFDATGIMAGAGLARELGEGIKTVFQMEQAFGRLNARLQMTGRELLDFKKNVGGAITGTGQRLEDVLPAVETMASRGNVRAPGQLTQMAGMLAQVRATTGEDVSGLAGTVVEILRNQQKEVTAQNAQTVIDTLQSARVRGAFNTAGEAGNAVQGIAGYGNQLHLSTQQMGGLAAVASQAGQSGQGVLQHLLSRATELGGANTLNGMLGQNVFTPGRQGQAVGMNPAALGQINMQNPQVMAQITNITGASGGDLQRFVEAFRGGMGRFGEVTRSFGESQRQFDLATDNFSSTISKFKQRTIEASRGIGEGLSAAAQSLIKGNGAGVVEGLSAAGGSAMNNAGTLAGAVGLSAGVGMLAGGGINSLLRRMPGASGAIGAIGSGVAGAAIAEATGVQKVYVVNAAEMGGGGIGDLAGFGGKIAGVLSGAGMVAGAGALGYAAGTALDWADQQTGGNVGNWIQDALSNISKSLGNQGIVTDEEIQARMAAADARIIAQAAKEGMENATVTISSPMTNPSDIQSRGASR